MLQLYHTTYTSILVITVILSSFVFLIFLPIMKVMVVHQLLVLIFQNNKMNIVNEFHITPPAVEVNRLVVE